MVHFYVLFLKVDKLGCYSDTPKCFSSQDPKYASTTNVGMPIGHAYDKYNISKITLIGNKVVEYIRVEYRNPTSSEILVQELGNPKSTGTKSMLTNLEQSPITYVAVWSVPMTGSGIVFPQDLAAFKLRTNSSKTIMVGKIDSSKMYLLDDYFSWGSRVRLCGVKMYGGYSRVNGIGLRWCSYKAVLA